MRPRRAVAFQSIAPNASPGGVSQAGTTYVIFGGSGPKSGGSWASTYSISTLMSGTNGFQVNGFNASEYTGSTVNCLDINGDGKKDLVIGAPNSTQSGYSDAGAAYVLYGQNYNAWPSTFNLKNLH